MRYFSQPIRLLPALSEPREWLNHLRYFYIRFVIAFTFYFALIGTPVYAFYNSNQQEAIFECMFISFNEIILVTKVITFVYKSDQFYELTSVLDKVYCYEQPNDEYVERIAKKTKKVCHFLTATGPRVVLSVALLGGIVEALDSLKMRNLHHRTRCWFPFDVEGLVIYEIYVIVFSVYFVLNLINALFIDTLIVCMLLHMLTQAKIVNHKLVLLRESAIAKVVPNIPKDLKTSAQAFVSHVEKKERRPEFRMQRDAFKGNRRNLRISLETVEECASDGLASGISFGDELKIQREMSSLLREALAHQREIFDFLTKFEEFFNAIFFIILLGNLTSSVVILAWAATTTSISVIMILHMGAPFMYLCELVLYSFLVDKVTEENEATRESVYASDWFGSTTRFKRSLCTVMAMANQPKSVIVAGFIPLTLNTVQSVLSTAYSYFMVLLKFD